jgi:hypothetical protein
LEEIKKKLLNKIIQIDFKTWKKNSL